MSNYEICDDCPVIKDVSQLSSCEKDGYILEIKRLRKEKKWLLDRITRNYGDKYSQIRVKELDKEMQQALKE